MSHNKPFKKSHNSDSYRMFALNQSIEKRDPSIDYNNNNTCVTFYNDVNFIKFFNCLTPFIFGMR